MLEVVTPLDVSVLMRILLMIVLGHVSLNVDPWVRDAPELVALVQGMDISCLKNQETEPDSVAVQFAVCVLGVVQQSKKNQKHNQKHNLKHDQKHDWKQHSEQKQQSEVVEAGKS